MNSYVKERVPYQALQIDPDLLTIRVPSWERVCQPLHQFALKLYQEQTGKHEQTLTDSICQQVDELPANTVQELDQLAIQSYQSSQSRYRYYYVVWPALLKAMTEQTSVVVDEVEASTFIDQQMSELQTFADEAGLTLEQYAHQMLQLEDPSHFNLQRRAYEDFVFHLVATQWYQEEMGDIDELDYEAYIQRQVLDHGADAIEVKMALTFERFKVLYPIICYGEALYDYYFPQITFELDPTAPFEFHELPTRSQSNGSSMLP